MKYKILESSGVEIEYIDGAAFNNLAAACLDGILPEVLNECHMYSSSNSVSVSTGVLVINGFRIKITEEFTYVFSGTPATDSQYSVVGRLSVFEDKSVYFTIEVMPTENYTPSDSSILTLEQGERTLEIGRFIYGSSGITDLSMSAPILSSAGGIKSIQQTVVSNESNGINVVTVSLVNGQEIQFRIKNGQKGDSGIGNALLSNDKGESDENGYTQYAINQMVSKPNLLINPNFRINQRGQSTYQATGENTIYTVDRWKLDGNGTVTVSTNGVNVKSNSNDGTLIFRQIIENSNVLINQDACISVCVDGMIYSGLIEKISTNTSFTLSVNTGCQVMFDYTGKEFELVFVILDTTERTINWAKLEIGGAYSLFSPPIYAEELLKCQRYYQKLNINSLVMGGNMYTEVQVPLPTSLRGIYTISGIIKASGIAENLKIYNSYLYNNAINLLMLNGANSLVEGQLYTISSSTLELDGEL